MPKFNTIGLVGRPGHAGVVDSLNRLLAFLAERDITVILDAETSGLLSDPQVTQCPRDELSRNCDLVIVVGGDGSMLNVAKTMASEQVPVIGVNRGKLGFLTDILPEELETRVAEVLDGEFSVEKRFLLDLYLRDGDHETFLGSALNDVVLHPGKAAQMIEFELFVNDSFVYSQESDGLIVATPTGSTAYNLSAGGPIIGPRVSAIAMTPICPHTLGNRSVIFDNSTEITVVSDEPGPCPRITVDGRVRFEPNGNFPITITVAEKTFRLMQNPDHSHFAIVRDKLDWGDPAIR